MKNQSIALDLKVWRRKAGLTQVDLAHLLSASPSRVSQIEAGGSLPRPDELLALSLIYGKPLNALVSGLLDNVAYGLVGRLRRMPPAPKNWRAGFNRAHTLSGLARRLETFNDGKHDRA